MSSHGAQKKTLKYFEERAAQNVAVKPICPSCLVHRLSPQTFLSSYELKIAFNPLTPGRD